MMSIIYFLAFIGVVGAGGWLAWSYLGGNGGGALFGGSRDRRIGVSEVASVDGKRKLVLVYRDGVEHLIMTGGPIDVVIEQGIPPARRSASAHSPHAYEPRQMAPVPVASPPVYGQPAPMPAVDPAATEQIADLPTPAVAPPAGFGRLRQRIVQPTLDPYAGGEQRAASGGQSLKR